MLDGAGRWRSKILDVTGGAATRDAGAAGVLQMPKLRPSEFDEIRSFAKQRFGLDLRPGKEELVSARLARSMRQGRFRSFREYLDFVTADSTGQALVALINALTTNHTSFYRESDHFRFMAAEILPRFRQGSRLRIWCAACSTGEEPYSAACTVAEGWNGTPGLRPLDVRGLRILATDISTRVLDSARAALYPPSSLAPAPPLWLKSYFERPNREGLVKVKPEIAAAVEFRRLNLIEHLSFSDVFHLIFCRNVMIYFDKPTQEELVRRLSEHLEPGGYLFVGHSESLAGVKHALTYVRPAIYRKDDGKRRLPK
jgi:chemotaxis protein methyltransferase CheR